MIGVMYIWSCCCDNIPSTSFSFFFHIFFIDHAGNAANTEFHCALPTHNFISPRVGGWLASLMFIRPWKPPFIWRFPEMNPQMDGS